MAVHSKFQLEEYQYGVQVRRGRQLYMMSEKKIYFGEWIIDRRDPIIIIEMSKKIAEHEAPFYREVNGHDNIIRTFASVANPSNLTIFVQEYAPQGDLADCLMDNRLQINQRMLVQMFTQVADAMNHVVTKRIIHGDLGCRNILVFRLDSSEPRNNLVKITDFGLARWIDRAPADETLMVVPIRYCAPEILRNNRHSSYSEKSDVYSMGVLIWEALSNSEIPYSSIAGDDIVRTKKLNNENLTRPTVCDRHLWVLMNNCWNRDPQERPSFAEINDSLMNMRISEVAHESNVASPRRHYDYELDIHVKIKGALNNSYPVIHKAQWISDNKGPIILIEKNEEPSEHELSFYTKFKNHRHVVQTYGFVDNDHRSIMILQERAPLGNLKVLLESGQFQPSAQVLVAIFLQIINTMVDIVAEGLVHGDLRCENILVFEMHPSDPDRNLVKLSNFTLAHKNDPSLSDERRLPIPVRYCALEILRSAGRSNYSEYSDVYSMGVLMWQAYSKGKLPYQSSTTNSEVRQRKLKGEKPLRPYMCHEQIWSIIEECLLNEPSIRLEFAVLKSKLDYISNGPIEPYKYELNVDIRQKQPLNGSNGKFFEADWIRKKKNSQIILYVMDETTAAHEVYFCLKLKDHPHILRTFGLVKNDLGSVMLLQERASHGDLQTLLQSEQFQPSPKVLVKIFLQIVDAMIYITKQGIIHGDLRCGNILVFLMDSSEPANNLVKVTNFSLTRAKDQLIADDTLISIPVRYCAIEILGNGNESSYSELSDVYSMGFLMWEAFSKGKVPYGSRTTDHDVRQRRLNNEKLTKPKNCPAQLWTAIEHCWLVELSIRFNFEELKIQLLKFNDTPDPLPLPKSDPLLRPDPERLCQYCGLSFPEGLIELHQKSYCKKVPSPAAVVIPPSPSYKKCDRCNEKILSSKIVDHQRQCRPILRPPKNEPRSQEPISSEPRSWWGYIRACLCFSRSKN